MKGTLEGLSSNELPTGIIAMEDIARVLGRPLAHLWKRVLGAQLPTPAEAPLPSYEPAGRDGLVDFESRELLLRTVLSGKDPTNAMEFLLARGSFPPTELGRIRCEDLLSTVMDLARAANGLCLGESLDDEIVEVDLVEEQGATQLLGALPGRRRGGRLEVISSKNPKRLLDAWVRHLVMCACVSKAPACNSFLVRRAEKRDIEVWQMPFLDRQQAQDFLKRLLGLYRKAWKIPLRVFPDASFAYANAWLQSQSENRAWEAVRQSLQPEGRVTSGDEQERVLARYLFGHGDIELLAERPEPPELSFAELSGLVFRPMLELCSFEVQRNE
jgi:exonuclease V gamma subunit